MLSFWRAEIREIRASKRSFYQKIKLSELGFGGLKDDKIFVNEKDKKKSRNPKILIRTTSLIWTKKKKYETRRSYP